MKRIFRCDTEKSDPSHLKNKLSEFGNRALDDIWLSKGCPKNIAIVHQQLECEGNLQRARFGSSLSPRYDGIHMRGEMAVQHYTGSFANFLLDTLPQFQNSKNRINITPSHISPPSYSRSYADSVKNGRARSHNQTQPQFVERNRRYTAPQYSVHTQNRFSVFQSRN